MSTTYCNIVIFRASKKLVSYSAEVEGDGAKARLRLNSTTTLVFTSTPAKPALKMAMEQVILHFKGYTPQTDRVTVEAEDLGF